MTSMSAEVKQVLNAIDKLIGMPQVRQMPYSLIAETCQLKESKVRQTLQYLDINKMIIRTEIGKFTVPRYFYTITELGREMMGTGDAENQKMV